jgi:hypothetical protein
VAAKFQYLFNSYYTTRINGRVKWKCEFIQDLQNQGRYYIAKIVEPPGKVVARLLVDKLNGIVHFPKNKLKR